MCPVKTCRLRLLCRGREWAGTRLKRRTDAAILSLDLILKAGELVGGLPRQVAAGSR